MLGDAVVTMLMFVVTPGWDDGLAAWLEDDLVQTVGVVGTSPSNVTST